MRPRIRKTLIFVIVLGFLSPLTPVPSWAAFNDIENNWARDAILVLEERGIFQDLWEQEFLPHSPLDHAAALELVARAFKLSAEEQDKLAAWLQKTLVASEEGITRGEFAALLANPLGLSEHTAVPSGWYPSFVDLSPDYPGFLAVEVLQRLALLPNHLLGRFEPYRLITRSEVAALLEEALRLEAKKGLLVAVDDEQQQIVIQTDQGENLELNLSLETLFIGPQGLSKEHHLNVDQQLLVLLNGNQALLIEVAAEEKIQTALWKTFDNIVEILADVLTPTQVAAIVSGDWEQLSEEIQYELYQELVDRGIAPWEAEALLKQDWPSVQAMAKERLTQEGAQYLQVAPELIHAALARDWPKLLEYAQVELAERVLASTWLKGSEKP